MISEDELDELFEQVEATFEASGEELTGVVIFVSLETKGHVYGIGSGKARLVESMKTMVKELEIGSATGRGLH